MQHYVEAIIHVIVDHCVIDYEAKVELKTMGVFFISLFYEVVPRDTHYFHLSLDCPFLHIDKMALVIHL